MQIFSKNVKNPAIKIPLYRIFSWLWLITIIYLSLTERKLQNIDISHIDKLFHLLAYGLATIISLASYPKIKQRYIVLFLIVFSLSMEVFQLSIQGRFFEFLDLGANVVGILLALLFAKKIIRH